MKKWWMLAILLGLVAFTGANNIIGDREGYLKYGWVLGTLVIALTVIIIVMRHRRDAGDERPKE
jgi:hypothetical protein